MQSLLQLPEYTLYTFMALNSVCLLDCIRHLPPSLYRLALEAKHPELKDKKLSLRYSYRRKAQHYPVELLHVIDTVSSCFSGISVLELDTAILLPERAETEVMAAQLSSTLRSLTHLVRLEISGGLNSTIAAGLAEVLPSMTALQSFDILEVQCNHIVHGSLPVSGRGCFNNVMHALTQLSSLKSLKVCGFRDSSTAGVRGFCAALVQLRPLTSLCLSSCFRCLCNGKAPSHACGLHVTGELAAALVLLTRLESLQLMDCFSMDFIEPVLMAIGYLTALTHLNLARLNNMLPGMVSDIPQDMLQVPYIDPSDEDEAGNVDGSTDFLEDINFQKRLAPMLARLTSLQSLNLGGSWMWGGDQAVVESLAGLTMLTQLSLNGFCRPYFFWEHFGEQVTALRRLSSLAVNYNGLLVLEATQLVGGLSTLPKLVCLRGDVDPLAMLHDHLQKIPGLTRLELFGSNSSALNKNDVLKSALRDTIASFGERVQIVNL